MATDPSYETYAAMMCRLGLAVPTFEDWSSARRHIDALDNEAAAIRRKWLADREGTPGAPATDVPALQGPDE